MAKSREYLSILRELGSPIWMVGKLDAVLRVYHRHEALVERPPHPLRVPVATPINPSRSKYGKSMNRLLSLLL